MTRTVEPSLGRPTQGVFSESELERLPEPVQRMFRTMIAQGTPLAQSARLTMRGRIKLNRWTRFRGHELITPSAGFVWAARAGLISGFDRYVNGTGEMRWKLLGLIPVLHATGPDVTRSAATRAAGEGVWIPTALLPRFGTHWTALDDTHVESHHTLGDHRLAFHHTLDPGGHLLQSSCERWGDPDRTGSYALHPFGIEYAAHRALGGLTIPSAGRAGWHHGTSRWNEGVFFEYEIDTLTPDPSHG